MTKNFSNQLKSFVALYLDVKHLKKSKTNFFDILSAQHFHQKILRNAIFQQKVGLLCFGEKNKTKTNKQTETIFSISQKGS